MGKALFLLSGLVFIVVVLSIKAQDLHVVSTPQLSEPFLSSNYAVPLDDESDTDAYEKYIKYQRVQDELHTKLSSNESMNTEELDNFYIDYILFVEKHSDEILAGVTE